MKFSRIVMFGFALCPLLAIAHEPGQEGYHEEPILGSSEQLSNWCLNEMRARYAAKGIATFGHASDHKVDGNMLHARVRLSIDGTHYFANCQAAMGAKERYASFSAEDPRIQ